VFLPKKKKIVMKVGRNSQMRKKIVSPLSQLSEREKNELMRPQEKRRLYIDQRRKVIERREVRKITQ
jgi:hypothetical protein